MSLKVSITVNPVKHLHQLLTELVWVLIKIFLTAKTIDQDLIIDLQLKTILTILISNR